jgi:hypothetical protein
MAGEEEPDQLVGIRVRDSIRGSFFTLALSRCLPASKMRTRFCRPATAGPSVLGGMKSAEDHLVVSDSRCSISGDAGSSQTRTSGSMR